jgi:CBS domain containing-hemolysin-like protein
MSGQGNGNGQGGDRRNTLLWKIQGLLKRREAESVRDRVEELLEEPARRDAGPRRDEVGSGLDTHERILLGNVLRLRDKTAYDVMVPRADILAMPEDLTLDQAIVLIQREGHSRFPVYRGNLDDVVGMVHIKDVFAAYDYNPETRGFTELPVDQVLADPRFAEDFAYLFKYYREAVFQKFMVIGPHLYLKMRSGKTIDDIK